MADGTRVAWSSGTQKAAAVDADGNLLLKNVAIATPVTSGPSVTGTTYVDMPEMTATVTTKGNKTLILFQALVYCDTAGGYTDCVLNIDGTDFPNRGFSRYRSIGANDQGTNYIYYGDSPTAGPHTYKIRWRSTSTYTSYAVGLVRNFQVIELG